MGPHCSGYGEKCEALFCLCLKGCATLLLLCTIRGRGIQWLPLKLGVSIYCGSIGHNRVLRGCGHVNSPCEPSRRTGTVAKLVGGVCGASGASVGANRNARA